MEAYKSYEDYKKRHWLGQDGVVHANHGYGNSYVLEQVASFLSFPCNEEYGWSEPYRMTHLAVMCLACLGW